MIPPLAPYHGFEIGTLIENPGALLPPRPPLMKRMCSGRPGRECGMVLGWVVCVRAMAGQISHGICDGCSAIYQEELAEMGLPYPPPLDVGASHAGGLPLCAPGVHTDRQKSLTGAGDTVGTDGGRNPSHQP